MAPDTKSLTVPPHAFAQQVRIEHCERNDHDDGEDCQIRPKAGDGDRAGACEQRGGRSHHEQACLQVSRDWHRPFYHFRGREVNAWPDSHQAPSSRRTAPAVPVRLFVLRKILLRAAHRRGVGFDSQPTFRAGGMAHVPSIPPLGKIAGAETLPCSGLGSARHYCLRDPFGHRAAPGSPRGCCVCLSNCSFASPRRPHRETDGFVDLFGSRRV